MPKVEIGAAGHGDTACSAGVVAVEVQSAYGEVGQAAISIGTAQRERPRTYFGETKGGNPVTDSPTDGESLCGDRGDDVVPHGDSPSAEVQLVCAGEGEVSVPVLHIVASVGDGTGSSVNGGACPDGEGAGAESVAVADDQGTRGEVDAACAAVAPAQGEDASAGFIDEMVDGHGTAHGQRGAISSAADHFPGLDCAGSDRGTEADGTRVGSHGDAVIGADRSEREGATGTLIDSHGSDAGGIGGELEAICGKVTVQRGGDGGASGVGVAKHQRIRGRRERAEVGGASGSGGPVSGEGTGAV